jgi:site-specific DNA-methyltransferase (adenine-specific)
MTERVLQGDCLQVLPTLPDNSVDLVLTDPPYFKVKGDAWDRQWDKPAQFLAWLDQVVEQFARVLKPNGSLYLFASPQMAARVECQIAQRLNPLNRIRWTKSQGWHQKAQKEALRSYLSPWEEIIFAEHYGSDSYAMGEAGYDAKCDELRSRVYSPLRSYMASELSRAGWTPARINEAMGFAPRGMAETRYFGASQWQLPTETHYERLRTILGAGFYERAHSELMAEYASLRQQYEAERQQYEDLRRPFAVTAAVPHTDVWDFPPVQAYPGKHPCEKPQALLRHIITASSRPGAVVLDAFAGTGSTGMACKALGREFIGIELSEQYAAIARARIAGMDAQPELFAA